MRKLTSLVMGLLVGGSVLAGSVASASADERVRVEVRDRNRDVRIEHRPVVERREVERRVVRYPDRSPPEMPREAYGRWNGHVWQSGGYQWINGRYIYLPGHYMVERPGYRWVSASWVHRGHRYVRVPGHWAR
jgi:hypothetical protein